MRHYGRPLYRDGVRALFAVTVLLVASPAFALEVHVSPGASGDGNEASPYGTVDEALGATGAGDTVWLHEGDYGDLTIGGESLTVAAAEGETPRIRTLTLQNATGVVVRGLSISLSHAESYESGTMVSPFRPSVPSRRRLRRRRVM